MSEEKPKATGARFKPGQSGNPSGRPRGLKAVEEAARAHTALAISTLAEIARSKKAPAAARVSAAEALLDRGWGKPKQAVEATLSFDLSEMIRKGRERALAVGEAAE